MAKWIKEGIFIRPNFNMVCEGCRDPLATFYEAGYVLCNFPINSEEPGEYDSFVIDRTYRCNLCGYQDVFGVAVKREHFLEMLDYADKNGAMKVNEGNPQNYQVD